MSQRMPRPTLRAVADATGFSPSTVSRALRNDPRVVPATREQITATAERLGFTQNALASSLRTGVKLSLVGLLIPDVADPFFGAVAAGVQAAASSHRLEVLIGCHNNNPEEQDRLVRQMVSHRVPALIVVPAPGPVPIQLSTEAQFGTTVVSVDRPAPHLGCDSVTTDNEEGARALTLSLLERGHERFAVVSLDTEIWTQSVRLQAVTDTLAGAGITLDPGAVARADESGTIPTAALDEILLTHKPTAVIGLSVRPLVQVVDASHRLDLDLELASFDGHPLFDLLDARIHCVEQSADALGRAAVDMLIERRDGGRPPRQMVLPVGELVVRGRRAGR